MLALSMSWHCEQAFLGADEWTAVVTALASGVTSYLAYHGTTRKITRYSNTVDKISAKLIWWKSLSDVDRSNVSRIHELIAGCEDLFEREREAWLSTSAKKLDAPVDDIIEPQEKASPASKTKSR